MPDKGFEQMLNQGDMWAASKHMQRCAAVLVIKKIQIKITVKYYFAVRKVLSHTCFHLWLAKALWGKLVVMITICFIGIRDGKKK